ncbi:MAG TPA: type IX secretion system sortase PorU [Candidatus Cloacimonadota bacterium]|nr:type IX secretion system sortase PorU [Candidatus Cloacimonadota bacterium]
MRRLAILLVLVSAAWSLWGSFSISAQRGQELLVEFQMEPFQIIESGGFVQIRTDDVDYPAIPGAPSVPYTEFKIAIPPYGEASYEVLSVTTETLNLPARVAPVPTIRDDSSLSEYEYSINEALYRQTNPGLISSSNRLNFRGHPFYSLTLNPFQYDGDKQLRVTTSAQIRISLQGNTNERSSYQEDAITELMLSQFLNPESGRVWQETSRNQIYYTDFSKSGWWMRIETYTPGMFKIFGSQIAGKPIGDIDPRSFRLFTTTGQALPFMAVNPGNELLEVPIYVSSGGSSSFTNTDFIAFYGTDRTGYSQNSSIQANPLYHNPYSNNTVYWLTAESQFPGEPLRITDQVHTEWTDTITQQLDTVHMESENHRRELYGHDWYDTRLFGSTTANYDFTIDLPDLHSGFSQTLQFRLKQEDISSALTHSIMVWVNNVLVPSNQSNPQIHTWLGTATFDFSASVNSFNEGNNTIRIQVIRGNFTDNLFLDYYRVTYTRKFTKGTYQYIVNPANSSSISPTRYAFTGSSSNVEAYLVSSNQSVYRLPVTTTEDGFYVVASGTDTSRIVVLRSNEYFAPPVLRHHVPDNLADNSAAYENIIITPAEFASKAQELAGIYQQSWGLSSKVVLQDDIFAQFNGGHPDPLALRQYIRYAFYNYPAPKLKTVTLLGLGTVDWKNYSGSAAAKNRIMIYQHPSNLTRTASDDYLGMINTNNYPEVAIGRYPVSSVAELTTMLNNFRSYTETPTPGLWRNSMVFVADDLNNGNTTGEWDHTVDTEEVSRLLHPSLMIDKIFAVEYEYDEFQNKPRVRDEMFSKINEGRLIWYYVGHGSFDVLGAENYYTGATDMGRFQNAGKLPLFIASSCKVSHLDYWAIDSLGQKTVLMNNLGAVASIGATRISYPYPNNQLMKRALANIANLRNPVAYSLMDAKIRYTEWNSNDETYILLGDPNLRVIPPQRDSTMTISKAGRTDIMQSRERAIVSGQYPQPGLAGEADLIAFGTDNTYSLSGNALSQKGAQLFRAKVSVNSSSYTGSFFIPDDIVSGESGVVIAYTWDETSRRDYLSYYHPLKLSDEAIAVPNPTGPSIQLFLGSYDFREGDVVGSSPMLYARISDEHGINVTGSAGHNILLILDNALQPIPVTQYFSYDTDSYTTGTLVYPLTNLKEGPHTLQIVAFDNFNKPEVANTTFIVRKSGAISLENLLVYPNPVQTNAHVTFIISQPAEITLDIFTMSGKRIRRITTQAVQGFNQIPFDGRDDFGARIANNTYFIRIKAKTSDGKSIEKLERLVIYK